MIEADFSTFVDFKQNNWVRLFLIAKFAYNNANNINIGYIFFELNYKYYLCITYKKDLDLCSILKIAKKLFFKI